MSVLGFKVWSSVCKRGSGRGVRLLAMSFESDVRVHPTAQWDVIMGIFGGCLFMFVASVKDMPFLRSSVSDISKSFVQRILRTHFFDTFACTTSCQYLKERATFKAQLCIQVRNVQTQAQNVACLGHPFGFSWLK